MCTRRTTGTTITGMMSTGTGAGTTMVASKAG